MISFFLRRPVMVCMLLIGASMLGVISYQRLPVELIPFAELPMLTVRVQTQQESDPQYLERQAVIPLESAIAGLEGIERIESYIEQQSAMLFVYYTRGSDQKYAFLKLQERVEAARADLSDEFFVMVFKIDTEQLATRFMSVDARGVGTLDQIRHVLDEKVVPDLERLDGMANVVVYGGREQLVEVVLNEDVMHSYGLTLSSVNDRIQQASAQRQYLGEAYDGRQRFFVNLVSDFDSIEELEETIIRPEDGLRLGQIATIFDGTAIGESISRVNGMEAVSISLVSDREANLLALAKSARETIAQLNQRLEADGVELLIQRDSAEVIEDNIGDIKSLAVVGALLAVGVLWVFLRNLSLVAIVAAAVPISVLIAMNLLYALDVTLNTLSMVGIAIAVGMLLDNSIVVLESIYRQVARGGPVHEAVVTGVSQVWRAVAAATLTTVCVFMPFVFSENFLVRILGRQVGVSIISTLLVSLVVALLLIPVFTHRLFANRGFGDQTFNTISQRNRLMQIYSLVLKSCMRFPARTIVVAVTALFFSVVLSLAVSIDSSEEVELTTFDLYATLPAGTTLELADRQAQQIDARVADIEELEERQFEIEADDLHLSFELKEGFYDIARRNLATVKWDVSKRLRDTFPHLHFSSDQPSTGRYQGGGNAGAGRAFQRLLGIGQGAERIVLRGNDLELMRTVADDIRYNLERLPGVAHANPGASKGQPEIALAVDKAATAYFGVAPDAIASGLSDFQSQLSSRARLKRGTDEIDVVLSSTGHPPRQVDDLRQLQISTESGAAVPLMHLADLQYAFGYGQVNRVNQQKEVEISYRFDHDVTGSKELLDETRAAVDRLAEDFYVPAGMSLEVEHDETDLADFYFLIGATILLIYMILASVFESLVAPLSMMITLPLAATGALWGLILTGDSIYNANALVGFLILLGVVVNNGIILIDYARLLQWQGYRLGRALLSAGQVRVRPILITALSTILAMLPLAMGNAEYVAQIGAPFATAVIGGLITGTVFTLVLVPTVYFGLATTALWLQQLNWKIKVAQIAALVAGALLIHYNTDSILWQVAAGATVLGLVPGLTWFVQTSLRHSRADPIPAGVELSISIRNVVKVYDAPSRFARQWGRGARQEQHHPGRYGDTGGRWEALVWRLPLLAFHCYLTYFYQQNWLWIVVFAVALYAHALSLAWVWLPTATGFVRRSIRFIYHLCYWLLPAPHLYWFYTMWDEPAPVATVGGLWYAAAAINRGARRLHSGRVNVDAITGRFRRSRRAFYLIVRAIPVIGKRKKPFVALRGISLEIESGMFGLIGPNGAGKTTLMRIICGILDQSLGKVRINDIDLSQRREELQSLIGYLPQEFGTYESMTARQFLDYQALLKGKWDTEERDRVVGEALSSVHLDDSADTKIGGFSGGMKQRIGIAQTLLQLPRILLVDEPTAGLDPRERIRFRNLLAELGRDRAVIFSTHIIEDISSSCNRLAVLGDGEVRFHGTPQQMVELTRGAVWQAHVSEPRFEELRQHARIVHHMRDGDSIRVRLLAASQPISEAEAVTPTLEDSYLWLLDKEAG